MAALQLWYDGMRMGDTAQYNEMIETITDANNTQQGIAAELGAAMGDVNLEFGRFFDSPFVSREHLDRQNQA